jgi:uncharacterized protein (DUF433 family)
VDSGIVMMSMQGRRCMIKWPHLTPDDIYAAAAFAADYLAQEEIIFADGQRL